MNTTKNLFFIFISSTVILLGCSGSDDITDVPDVVTGPPVETNSPNTNYTPAFTGQTRIGGVQTTTPFQATVISSSLNAPWGITSLPDGRLLITQKGGQLRIATTAGAI